jgi:predicted DNA-binding WGR domain protein
MSDIPVTGWYLELHDDTRNHHKYYTVLSAEDGTVIYAWGRVGTKGQSKVLKVDPFSSDDTAGRQKHSKMAKGYQSSGPQDVRFVAPSGSLATARTQGSNTTNDGTASVIQAFFKARTGPQFAGDKDATIAAYGTFTKKAERLIDEAATKPFEEVYGTFEELQEAWKELVEQHDQAGATIQIVSGLLRQRLLSGDLTK